MTCVRNLSIMSKVVGRASTAVPLFRVSCPIMLRGAGLQGEEVYFTDAAAAFRTLNLGGGGGGGGGGSSSSSSDEEGNADAVLAARQRGTRPVRALALDFDAASRTEGQVAPCRLFGSVARGRCGR